MVLWSTLLLLGVAGMALHPVVVLTVPVWAYLLGRCDTGARWFAVAVVVGLVLAPIALGASWWDPRIWAGVVAAAVVSALLPWLIGRHLRDRLALRRAEADLLGSLAQRERERAEQGRLRERARLAKEMHDTLGHQLSLIALHAGALEVGVVTAAERSGEAGRLRAATTRAAEQLNDIVGLLTDGADPAPVQPPAGDPRNVVGRAADAGLDARLTSTIDLDTLPPVVAHTVGRVIQEGLTNVVKHAPGARVEVHIERVSDEVVLRVKDRGSVGSVQSAPSGGRGLLGLTERVEHLGGSLRAEQLADGFELLAHVPIRAREDAQPADDRPGLALPHAELAAGRRDAQRSLLRVVLVPVLGLLLIAVLLTSYFTYVTIASVLTPEEFARIDVGDSRAETERILPPVEMLEPPTDRVATPPEGIECRFYEGEVSFFDRGQVYRVCFDDDTVSSTDVVHPEAP